MDKYTLQEIVEKIIRRDYDRWVQYMSDPEYVDQDTRKLKQSFFLYKEKKKMYEEDAQDIVELLS